MLVADLWTRYEAWLTAHAPAVLGKLNGPARAEDIAAFERELGWRLPDDLHASLAIHDGEDRLGLGAIAGMQLNSIAELARDWRAMEETRLAGQFQPTSDLGVELGDVIAQIEAIQAAALAPRPRARVAAEHVKLPAQRTSTRHPGLWDGHWQRGWLPLASTGCGNSWSLDVDPAPGGTVGQIVYFDHEVGSTPVCYPSFTAWFAAYLEAVENGRVRIVDGFLELAHDPRRGFGSE